MDNAHTPPGATSRWPWFRDQVWTDLGWQPNPTPGLGPGCQGGGPGSLYVPSPRSRKATWLWSAMFAALVLACAAGVVFAEDWSERMLALVPLLVGLAVFGLALFTALTNQSRRVTWDTAGLSDANVFAVRRIPWPAVASWVRENSAAASQAEYDEARRTTSHTRTRSTSARMRPQDIWAWIARDAQGRDLLSVIEPVGDERERSFDLLRDRITQQLRLAGRSPAVPDVFGLPDEESEGDEEDDEDDADSIPDQRQRELRAAFDAQKQRQRKSGRALAMAVLLPLALLALFTTWTAAWYEWGAERAEGSVVEHIVTGKDKALVQLVIAWRGSDGQERQLTTDGTRGHAEIAVGSPIEVLFDPARPEDARPALFLAVWLWTLVAWGFFALMAGVMALVTGAFGRR